MTEGYQIYVRLIAQRKINRITKLQEKILEDEKMKKQRILQCDSCTMDIFFLYHFILISCGISQ